MRYVVGAYIVFVLVALASGDVHAAATWIPALLVQAAGMRVLPRGSWELRALAVMVFLLSLGSATNFIRQDPALNRLAHVAMVGTAILVIGAFLRALPGYVRLSGWAQALILACVANQLGVALEVMQGVLAQPVPGDVARFNDTIHDLSTNLLAAACLAVVYVWVRGGFRPGPAARGEQHSEEEGPSPVSSRA